MAKKSGTCLRDKIISIIDGVAKGGTVIKGCDKHKIKYDKFFNLLDNDKELGDMYARARELRGEHCLDNIEQYQQDLRDLKIDSSTARVLIDTEKWKASKFYPKMYGDKVETNVTGSIENIKKVLVEFVDDTGTKDSSKDTAHIRAADDNQETN